MSIRVDWSALWKCVEQMGATPVDFSLDIEQQELERIDLQLRKGKEIDLEDLDFSSGVLSYQGRQVLLYIPNQKSDIEKVLIDGSKGRKFHVTDCKTLVDMRTKGKYESYYATNDLSGEFDVHGIDSFGRKRTGRVRLDVCMNCLDKLGYKGFDQKQPYSKKKQIVREFSIEEFFSIYSSLFAYLPQGIVQRNSAGYTNDWPHISAEYRRKVGYRCEQCGIDLSQHRKLLHVHHKDRVKSNNRQGNLIALCADCHKKEPYHEHMFVSPSDRKLIQRLRKEQELHDVHVWEDAFKFADTAFHGILFKLQRRGCSIPEIGLELMRNGRVAGELELAWPKQKVGVATTEKSKQLAEEQGWFVLMMNEALDSLDELIKALKNIRENQK